MGKGKTTVKAVKGKLNAKDLAAQVDAINRVQAVIEFKLDGTIITANDNFLNCLGYTLEEIQGKHHRMFADPAYAASPEYAAFWTKLNRGEFDAGIYRRLGKGGKDAVITGDLIHSPLQAKYPELAMRVDYDPDQGAATRRKFLETYCDTNTLCCFAHFPSPSRGYVKRWGDGFKFEAV